MAREHRLPPSAASLSASMRDLGYSLESAIADLVDNSISAKATKIEIFCDLAHENPALAIIDDGEGMGEDEVISALRHGSKSPVEDRDPMDLGRFGLGLKTASFSQCKKLTVISRVDETVHGAEWDLNEVDKKDDWIISILEEDDFADIPYMSHLELSGTMVLWRDLDRLFEDEIGDRRHEIVNDKLDVVEKHLALVFHRFLSGEIKGRKKLSIYVNGHLIVPFDPFCTSNPATQILPNEVVRVKGQIVRMQPYILPHHSRLSAADYDFYQNRSDFISNQGVYIYRSGRLMAWGDWFRLIPKGEATKLARVQIDFPNSLDESWTINIKKSRATPPHAVRERLRQIIEKISGRSTRVHRGRGAKLFDELAAPVWERYADHGTIRYSLNLDHPLIHSVLQSVNDEQRQKIQILLDAVPASLPVEMIYSDFSTSPRKVLTVRLPEKDIREQLDLLHGIFCKTSALGPEGFREIIKSTRLFDDHPEITELYLKEIL